MHVSSVDSTIPGDRFHTCVFQLRLSASRLHEGHRRHHHRQSKLSLVACVRTLVDELSFPDRRIHLSP